MSDEGDEDRTRGPGVQLKGEEEGEGEILFGVVVIFNMHSPDEEGQAALSAGAPVWPL